MQDFTWVFPDGDCRLCQRLAEACRQRDRAGRLRFVNFQEAPTPPMTPELRLASEVALHAIAPDGRVLSGGRAIVHILGELGYRRTQGLLGSPLLIGLVERVYAWVAEHRSLLSRVLRIST